MRSSPGAAPDSRVLSLLVWDGGRARGPRGDSQSLWRASPAVEEVTRSAVATPRTTRRRVERAEPGARRLLEAQRLLETPAGRLRVPLATRRDREVGARSWAIHAPGPAVKGSFVVRVSVAPSANFGARTPSAQPACRATAATASPPRKRRPSTSALATSARARPWLRHATSKAALGEECANRSASTAWTDARPPATGSAARTPIVSRPSPSAAPPGTRSRSATAARCERLTAPCAPYCRALAARRDDPAATAARHGQVRLLQARTGLKRHIDLGRRAVLVTGDLRGGGRRQARAR